MIKLSCSAVRAKVDRFFRLVPQRVSVNRLPGAADTLLGEFRTHIHSPEAFQGILCRPCYDYYKEKEREFWGPGEGSILVQ